MGHLNSHIPLCKDLWPWNTTREMLSMLSQCDSAKDKPQNFEHVSSFTLFFWKNPRGFLEANRFHLIFLFEDFGLHSQCTSHPRCGRGRRKVKSKCLRSMMFFWSSFKSRDFSYPMILGELRNPGMMYVPTKWGAIQNPRILTITG